MYRILNDIVPQGTPEIPNGWVTWPSPPAFSSSQHSLLPGLGHLSMTGIWPGIHAAKPAGDKPSHANSSTCARTTITVKPIVAHAGDKGTIYQSMPLSRSGSGTLFLTSGIYAQMLTIKGLTPSAVKGSKTLNSLIASRFTLTPSSTGDWLERQSVLPGPPLGDWLKACLPFVITESHGRASIHALKDD